jgi:hypothetical protein
LEGEGKWNRGIEEKAELKKAAPVTGPPFFINHRKHRKIKKSRHFRK